MFQVQLFSHQKRPNSTYRAAPWAVGSKLHSGGLWWCQCGPFMCLAEEDLQVQEGAEQPQPLGGGAEGDPDAGGHGTDVPAAGRLHPPGTPGDCLQAALRGTSAALLLLSDERQRVKSLGVGFTLTWAVKILPASLLVTSAHLSGVCTCWVEGKFDPSYVDF